MSFIEEVLKDKSRREVLRRLCGAIEAMAGAELARLTGLSRQQTHDALDHLVELEIVERSEVSSSQLFRLNWGNSLAVQISRRLSVKGGS